MIDRLIDKVKLRRGTEAQRIQVVLEEGELIWTTDTDSLYVGDGVTLGGLSVASKNFTVTSLSGVPDFAKRNDIIHNKTDGITYIVDLSGSNLYLREFATLSGSNTGGIGGIGGDSIQNNSLSANHLSNAILRPNGGLLLDNDGLSANDGIYINYDDTTLTIEGGKLKVRRQDSNGTPIWTPKIPEGGFVAGNNSTFSINTDNSTITINNGVLSAIGFEDLLNKFRRELNTSLSATRMPAGIIDYLAEVGPCRYPQAVAVSRDNKVYSWGVQLGKHVDEYDYNYPPSSLARCRFWDTDNEDYMENNPTVTITKVIYGNFQMFALLSNGTVWVNGNKRYNGFGVQTTTDYTFGFSKVTIPDSAIIRDISLNQSDVDSYESFFAISTTNNLYVWGYNAQGQLGVGDTTIRYSPVKITSNGLEGNVSKAYIAGSRLTNSIIVTLSGDVYVTGYNAWGALGQGNTTAVKTFSRAYESAGVPLTGVSSLAHAPWGQASNMFVIKNDGTLWGSGYNAYYQLANGTTTQVNYFKRISNLTGVSKVVVGPYGQYGTTVMAMTTGGDVYTWGFNGNGQCGVGHLTAVKTPQLVGTGASDIYVSPTYSGACFGYKKNGKLYLTGYRADTKPNLDQNQTRFFPMHVGDIKSVQFYTYGSDDGYNGLHLGTLVSTYNGRVYGQGNTQGYIIGTFVANTATPLLII